jgi:hypothetical protein
MLLVLYVVLKIRYPETDCRYPRKADMTQVNVGDTVNYGKYTDDHWLVDELLALARGERTNR